MGSVARRPGSSTPENPHGSRRPLSALPAGPGSWNRAASAARSLRPGWTTCWIPGRAVRCRKAKLDVQTRLIVLHFDRRAMQPRDDRDEAETEATARGASAALDPIKPLENVLTLIARDARAPIRDRDRGPRAVGSHRH